MNEERESQRGGLDREEQAALERLMRVAATDTGQGRRVADFILAWWNAYTMGGWDPTDLWSVDRTIAADMLAVLGMVRNRAGHYPNEFVPRADVERLIEEWRPERWRQAADVPDLA